ncbi:MAG: hypothetical protein KF791_19430 [Verrucomicrobiae bacterium]|nr:hypothetical protein [Verrucomicrobiae bacterium]
MCGRPAEPGETGGQALEQVARAYWWPVYGAFRDDQRTPDQAAALTGQVLARVSTAPALLRHGDHDGRLRRLIYALAQDAGALTQATGSCGDGTAGDSIVDTAMAEARDVYGGGTPVAMGFRDRWSVVVLEHALESLRREAEAAGRATEVERLLPYLARETPDWKVTDLADAVDSSEVDQLRDTFREAVRQEVGRTVTHPAGVASELNELFG